MPKNFNDFLQTINDRELLKEATNYMTTSLVTDEQERDLLFNVAIQKYLLDKYNHWLNS